MLAEDITPMDAWLNESLSASYGTTLHEPLPEELLAILVAELGEGTG